jgi:UDP-glucose 4-epimerase
MKILVTGGAGFIGANLCRTLVENHHVVVLDDLSTGSADNLAGLDIDLIRGTVLDPDTVRSACRGADAIVHLAAVPSVPRSLIDPFSSHNVNATGTLVVLDAAKQTDAHVVLASSSSVYGDGESGGDGGPLDEESPCRPTSPFGVSKLAAESYAGAYAASFGLDITAFRFFNVFGPLQTPDNPYAAVVPAFALAALRGEPLFVEGDGEQSRDFTYVDSVVEVLSEAVRYRRTTTGPVNLAFGTRTTVNELIAMLTELVGRRLDVRHTVPRPTDVRHARGCPLAFREMFPAAQPVPLRTGLSSTLAWLSIHTQTFGVTREVWA